jgi:hypothetical protein
MQASASFFEKKEAKKLSLNAAVLVKQPQAQSTKSFLLLFFKKEALAYLIRAAGE